MSTPSRLAAVLAAMMSVAGPALAQKSNAPGGSAPAGAIGSPDERVLTVARIEERIVVDGKLDEAAWGRAEVTGDFVQLLPDTGAPATERTEVRILYDANNLYIGAVCYDSQPDRMVANDRTEDFAARDSDIFGILLDTLHDGQTGFVFATNPAGARQDQQISSDGDVLNSDWDSVWNVAVSVNEQGWVAEFVVPFKTLRFSRAPVQEWGLNFSRRVRRLNQETVWAPIPRRYRWMRVSQAGSLRGLEGARQGSNLKLKPFLIGDMTQSPASGSPNRGGGLDGGLDLKYGLTQSLTLDLTYRTDFSQVETDQQQVNLTRFSLFFPEQREFFLENSGLFSIAGSIGRRTPGGTASAAAGVPQGGASAGAGAGARRAAGSANLIPFFSRRIGLSDSGAPIPIVGGARVSGRVSGYDVGFLAIRSGEDEDVGSTANNFIVARMARSFRANNWIGALVTHRDSSIPGDVNRVHGIDTSLRFFEKLEVAGYVLRSTTPGRSGQDQARLLDVAWIENDLAVTGQYEEVQSNFQPGVGYVRRRDAEHFSGEFDWLPRFGLQGDSVVRNFVLVADADVFSSSRTGRFETRQQKVIAGVDFNDGSNMGFVVQPTFERLYEPFTLRDVEIGVGDHSFRRYSAFYTSDRSRVVSGNVNTEVGGFWGGRNRSLGGTVDVRPSALMNLSINFNRSAVTLPGGEFTATLVGSRVGVAFSSRMFLNSFLQYNADTHQFSTNTRFRWTYRPLSDFFIVFNEQRDTLSSALLDRALIVKLTNLFDF